MQSLIQKKVEPTTTKKKQMRRERQRRRQFTKEINAQKIWKDRFPINISMQWIHKKYFWFNYFHSQFEVVELMILEQRWYSNSFWNLFKTYLKECISALQCKRHFFYHFSTIILQFTFTWAWLPWHNEWRCPCVFKLMIKLHSCFSSWHMT